MLTRPILQAAVATKYRYFGLVAVRAHVAKPVEGDCRANRESDSRTGSGNTNILAHTSRKKSVTVASFSTAIPSKREFSTIPDATSIPSANKESICSEKYSREIEEWTTQVSNMVAAQPELDVWFVESSIVSILLHHSGNGSLFDMDELEDVLRYMSMDVSRNVPRSVNAEERAILAAVVCSNMIGPPCVDVAVADNATRAILSISLGSEKLANYLEDAEGILERDRITVKKLAFVAKYFVALTNSNVL